MSYTPRPTQENDARSPEPAPLLRSAVLLSIAAAMLHGLNVSEHLAEWWGYGLFFLFAAAAQFVFGLVLMVRPWDYDPTGGRRDGSRYARPVHLAGAWANGFLVVLYLVTRTVGIPFFGPEAGQAEPFSAIGLVTKAVEAALVFILVRSSRRNGRPEASPTG